MPFSSGIPPETVVTIDPSEPPKHEMLFPKSFTYGVKSKLTAVGEFNTIKACPRQPFTSSTSTVTLPEDSPVKVGWIYTDKTNQFVAP